MSWAHFPWLWTVEPIVLIILLSVLMKIIVFNYRQIEILTEEMYSSVVKAQTFLQHVDREFEMMNACAKSVKSIFLNFGKAYREIAEGGKTIDDAFRSVKNRIPEELRSNISDFINLPLDKSLTSVLTDNQDTAMSKTSSLELALSKLKSGTMDKEFSFRSFGLKTSGKDEV